MPWIEAAVATAAAGTIAAFTDWLFMGVLFHDRYDRHPEVWRDGIRAGRERGAILWSCALDYVSAGAIVFLCMWLGATAIWPALSVAVVVWIAGPLAMQITNGLFIKFDPLLTLSHALGWLVRFLMAGLAAGIALP
jgi:hypothetical protein